MLTSARLQLRPWRDEDLPAFAALNETHFTPCVEIAWRLARKYWGFGYATEAARLAMDYGFRTVRLEEIVSFTLLSHCAGRGHAQG